MNLTQFLEDANIAIENGFGSKITILRMFNALMELNKLHFAVWTPTDEPECWVCECAYPCATIELIEKEINRD